ncbi:hypothetical protein [Pseudoduganella lurida]|nr:hypothetical protein [Pseudoduganella lurida]
MLFNFSLHKMTKEEWALVTGIVGAAAWIVPIFAALKSWLRRPVVTVIPSWGAQIGFTELGPVLNIKVALTANHDVLIDSVQLCLTHESGARFLFRWHEVVEVKGHLIFPGAQSQPLFQEAEAIAMKILSTDIKDVELRNRLSTHTETFRKFARRWAIERHRLMNAGRYDPEHYYHTETVQGLISFLRSQMIWRSGRYTLKFEIGTRTPAKLAAPVLELILSNDDIVLLQENSDNVEIFLKNATYNGIFNYVPTPTTWHWLDPEVRKVG